MGGIYGHIAPIFWIKMHLSDLGSGYTPGGGAIGLPCIVSC